MEKLRKKPATSEEMKRMWLTSLGHVLTLDQVQDLTGMFGLGIPIHQGDDRLTVSARLEILHDLAGILNANRRFVGESGTHPDVAEVRAITSRTIDHLRVDRERVVGIYEKYFDSR